MQKSIIDPAYTSAEVGALLATISQFVALLVHPHSVLVLPTTVGMAKIAPLSTWMVGFGLLVLLQVVTAFTRNIAIRIPTIALTIIAWTFLASRSAAISLYNPGVGLNFSVAAALIYTSLGLFDTYRVQRGAR